MVAITLFLFFKICLVPAQALCHILEENLMRNFGNDGARLRSCAALSGWTMLARQNIMHRMTEEMNEWMSEFWAAGNKGERPTRAHAHVALQECHNPQISLTCTTSTVVCLNVCVTRWLWWRLDATVLNFHHVTDLAANFQLPDQKSGRERRATKLNLKQANMITLYCLSLSMSN